MTAESGFTEGRNGACAPSDRIAVPDDGHRKTEGITQMQMSMPRFLVTAVAIVVCTHAAMFYLLFVY